MTNPDNSTDDHTASDGVGGWVLDEGPTVEVAMERAFWLERWQEGRIGFHQTTVHEDLARFAGRFLDGGPHHVLVPLCGKTVDLRWLADQGHTVVGVELAEIAARAVFEEAGLIPEVERVGALTRYRSGRLTVLQGDLFEADAELLGPVDRIWDRAAMVALPPELRSRYVQHLHQVAPGALLLLNAFAYDSTLMDGPPFSVPEQEVRARYAGAAVEVLDQQERIEAEPRWRSQGHTSWLTTTYLIRLPA